jgi:hypothetical protein
LPCASRDLGESCQECGDDDEPFKPHAEFSFVDDLDDNIRLARLVILSELFKRFLGLGLFPNDSGIIHAL